MIRTLLPERKTTHTQTKKSDGSTNYHQLITTTNRNKISSAAKYLDRSRYIHISVCGCLSLLFVVCWYIRTFDPICSYPYPPSPLSSISIYPWCIMCCCCDAWLGFFVCMCVPILFCLSIICLFVCFYFRVAIWFIVPLLFSLLLYGTWYCLLLSFFFRSFTLYSFYTIQYNTTQEEEDISTMKHTHVCDHNNNSNNNIVVSCVMCQRINHMVQSTACAVHIRYTTPTLSVGDSIVVSTVYGFFFILSLADDLELYVVGWCWYCLLFGVTVDVVTLYVTVVSLIIIWMREPLHIASRISICCCRGLVSSDLTWNK